MKKILKKFPKGTEFGSGTHVLSIWGDVMALVEGPWNWGDADPVEYDAARMAKKYAVWLTKIPADSRLVGKQMHFPRGQSMLHEQYFSYSPTHGMGDSRGKLDEPFNVWVEVDKFKNLSVSQSGATVNYLERERYIDVDNIKLSAAKWRKALGMTFDEVYEHDVDMGNAVDRAIDMRRGYNRDDNVAWAGVPGVYSTTQKGILKFIVSRKQKGL